MNDKAVMVDASRVLIAMHIEHPSMSEVRHMLTREQDEENWDNNFLLTEHGKQFSVHGLVCHAPFMVVLLKSSFKLYDTNRLRFPSFTSLFVPICFSISSMVYIAFKERNMEQRRLSAGKLIYKKQRQKLIVYQLLLICGIVVLDILVYFLSRYCH
jgi:hypothetical protein